MNWFQNVPVMGTNIGAKLKAARQKAGLSQRVLADKLGLHRSAIAKYEAEELKISAETLLRMAEVFETTVSEILGEGHQEEQPLPLYADPISAIRVYLDELEKSSHGFAWTDDLVIDVVNQVRESGDRFTKDELELFKSLRRSDNWKPSGSSNLAARDDTIKRGKVDENGEDSSS